MPRKVKGDLLKYLKKGSCFRVESFKAPYSFLCQRLSSLGIVRGATIEIVNISPLGGPVEIRCKGYNLALRQAELDDIDLAPINP